MKLLKKLLCALIVCTVFAPSAAFAEKSEIYTYDLSESEASAEEIACVNYIISVLSDIENGFTTEIDISDKYKIHRDQMDSLINLLARSLQYEHPELFYINRSISTKYEIVNDYITKIYIDKLYIMTAEEISASQALIDAECEKMRTLTADMTPVQKVLAVHDYIAANYRYDDRVYSQDPDVYALTSRTLNTMVEQKTGVCQGYAYLFKYIMNDLGVECVTVPSDNHNHVWNKVKLDGKWYNIDVTQDDPAYDSSTRISHKYFLLNDEEIKAADDSENTGIYDHADWNLKKWDGSDCEVSSSNNYSDSVLHVIPKQTVYKNGTFYCFDTDNNICTIDFENNILIPIYTKSSKLEWHPDETHSYVAKMSAMVLFDGDIYFNSSNEVFKFNPETADEEKVYEYKTDRPKLAHIYGLQVKDDVLYIEYNENYNRSFPTLIPIISAKGSDTPKFEMPCSAQTERDDITGEISVTVTIPDNLPELIEAVNIEDTPEVWVAQYDKDGLFIGMAEDTDASSADVITFTPDENCSLIKTFIWAMENNMQLPLSDAEIFNVE